MTGKCVSILKETRGSEKRVIVQPQDLDAFFAKGHEVLVESGAGEWSGCPDHAYRAAGARIVSTDTAWTESDFIFKYKAPGPQELAYLHPGVNVAAFMHAEGAPDYVEKLRASGANTYAYEFYRLPNGIFPLAVSDNEIAGRMGVLYGGYFLQSHWGGNGVFLPFVAGAPRAKVVVIGYGNAGGAAARLAASMGADVVVFGTRREGLRHFEAQAEGGVRCRINTPEALREEIRDADLVVGAILISTHDTPAMIDQGMLDTMKRGSMIVDVTCGYGAGYLPTFDKETTHQDPVYVRDGVLHCKIDAMPASVPITAAAAMSANIAPYLADLVDIVHGDEPMPAGLESGCVTANHAVLHPEVQRHLEFFA